VKQGPSSTSVRRRANSGNLPTDRLGPGGASPATGGYGTLGAGDTAAGNWTGTNSGVDRRQTRGYPGYGPGYSGSTVAPAAKAQCSMRQR
jgi:hypothetical protein